MIIIRHGTTSVFRVAPPRLSTEPTVMMMFTSCRWWFRWVSGQMWRLQMYPQDRPYPPAMTLALIWLTVHDGSAFLHRRRGILIPSVVSFLRLQGSERRTRPAGSGVTRRSRRHGATRWGKPCSYIKGKHNGVFYCPFILCLAITVIINFLNRQISVVHILLVVLQHTCW